MAVQITRGVADETTDAFAKQLEAYLGSHPGATAEMYRQNGSSVRLRITDPDFRGKTRSERHKAVWPILNQLPEDALNELTMLLLISPDETRTSMSSREFDDPIRSSIL